MRRRDYKKKRLATDISQRSGEIVRRDLETKRPLGCKMRDRAFAMQFVIGNESSNHQIYLVPDVRVYETWRLSGKKSKFNSVVI